jgi:PKHD-type hydroxylase
MFWFEPPNELVNWEFAVEDVLTDADIKYIENYVNDNKQALVKAEVRTEGNPVDNDYRRSSIMFLDDMDIMQEIYGKVYKTVFDVNAVHFKYALSYSEPFQYSVYDSNELGCYDVHCDSYLRNTSGFTRKISFSILLSDPSEFEGGDLLLHTEKTPVKMPLKKGSIILFPSFAPHSVTPVTKGVRKALVGWMCGPNLV